MSVLEHLIVEYDLGWSVLIFENKAFAHLLLITIMIIEVANIKLKIYINRIH